MTTMTKKQVQKIIDAADAVITAMAGTNDDVHPDNHSKMCQLYDELNDRYATPEIVRELARIALQSLDAEPIAWTDNDELGGQRRGIRRTCLRLMEKLINSLTHAEKSCSTQHRQYNLNL